MAGDAEVTGSAFVNFWPHQISNQILINDQGMTYEFQSQRPDPIPSPK
jgi:hypothetical protein